MQVVDRARETVAAGQKQSGAALAFAAPRLGAPTGAAVGASSGTEQLDKGRPAGAEPRQASTTSFDAWRDYAKKPHNKDGLLGFEVNHGPHMTNENTIRLREATRAAMPTTEAGARAAGFTVKSKHSKGDLLFLDNPRNKETGLDPNAPVSLMLKDGQVIGAMFHGPGPALHRHDIDGMMGPASAGHDPRGGMAHVQWASPDSR